MLRRTLCLALLATACNGEDETPEWQPVFSNETGALLRVWGKSAKDVYLVGADTGASTGIVRHFDGNKWKTLTPPIPGSLWWVQGVADDDIRMVGDDGTVLKYTPSTGAFEVRPTPTNLRLFGVWGSASNDVWYVGGNVGTNVGVVLRDDGNQITEVPLAATSSATFFKVTGFAANDVWLVGQRGRAVHWDGTNFVVTETPTALPLMGVHGTSSSRLYAVGGVADGVVLAWDGTSWQPETPMGLPQMIGVWAVDQEDAVACGFNGQIYRRTGGVWAKVPEKIPTYEDLHAVWVDEKGSIWAVGGNLSALTGGTLVHYGPKIGTEVEE